jgi:hypothetical protein
VREIRSQGSVRGVPGNRHLYRDTWDKSVNCSYSFSTLKPICFFPFTGDAIICRIASNTTLN